MTAARRISIAIWLAAMAGCVLIVARTQFTADLSAFLPKTPTREQLARDAADVDHVVAPGLHGFVLGSVAWVRQWTGLFAGFGARRAGCHRLDCRSRMAGNVDLRHDHDVPGRGKSQNIDELVLRIEPVPIRLVRAGPRTV